MAFRKRKVPTHDVMGRPFDRPVPSEEPPPSPTMREADDGLEQYLGVGEMVTAAVVGGVERGWVYVAVSNRGIWLTGPTWKPIHKVPNYELTAVTRTEGGFIIEAGSNRLPVRVWDAEAAERFVGSAEVWLEGWQEADD